MGLELALKLQSQFIDLDQEIEKETKQSISTIFKEKGEAHFRQLEKLHLEKIIEEYSAFVMATGGGTPCFFNNMESMENAGDTIFINTPISEIKRRLVNDTSRPLMQKNTLEDLLDKRNVWYSQAQKEVESLQELLSLY